MSEISLTDLLGMPVVDATGIRRGRVRELAMIPHDDTLHVASLIVRTKTGDRTLPFTSLASINGEVQTNSAESAWPLSGDAEGLFLLERDLLDQQIIDVHGRKVVRVNDVDLYRELGQGHISLKVASVDVGPRGAIRRLLKGVVPMSALRKLLLQIPQRPIPWEFVDLVETDPARRVKLKISLERLSKLHPADIADIVEDLPPDEREAVFETLNEEVAAETLEEMDPKVQKSIVESLDSDRAAEIVEEMDPDAAADLLGDLTEDHTSQILQEMAPADRKEITELLEYGENTAAGRMNTEFVALGINASAQDAIETLRHYEGGVETLSTIYIVDSQGTLVGAVPLAKLVLATPLTPLLALIQEPLISAPEGANDHDVAELFDKYNLLMLPVVDDHKKLTGVITSDDVISLLRAKL
jgi:CBS domain-containing protein/sporulation protein YlmC with PRC-barrel domain